MVCYIQPRGVQPMASPGVGLRACPTGLGAAGARPNLGQEGSRCSRASTPGDAGVRWAAVALEAGNRSLALVPGCAGPLREG